MTPLPHFRPLFHHYPINSILNCENTPRSLMWWKIIVTTTDLFLCLMFTQGKSSPPPPSSTPTLPSRFLTTLALQLSHTSVISGPASETYGNVTGKRWTRWLLTHSSPPTRGIFLPPHAGKTGGSTENQPAHSYICAEHVSLVFLLLVHIETSISSTNRRYFNTISSPS